MFDVVFPILNLLPLDFDARAPSNTLSALRCRDFLSTGTFAPDPLLVDFFDPSFVLDFFPVTPEVVVAVVGLTI